MTIASTRTTRSHRELFSLEGRTALVTGASGQLGRSLATAFYESGAELILADKDPSGCERWAKDRTERRILPLEMDVTREASVRATLERSLREFEKVDVLVNNAGIGIFTPWETRTIEEFQAALDVNLKGVFLCTQRFSESMRRRGRGSIINIGSIYGIVSADPRIYGDSGRNSSEVYGATKAGVIQMTRYYAVHLAPHGIRVNAISPGGVFNHQAESFVRNYVRKTPLGRMAAEEDIRGAAVFLASDASSYVTGQNLVVDGGFSIW